jgi:RimJ/RimL family protein N-acetyltransferase
MRIVLETRRLVLGEMSLNDLDFIAEMLGDPAVMRYYPKVCNRHEAVASIRKNLDRYADDGFGLWLAREKSSGRPVGRIGLLKRRMNGAVETEIGWMIHRPYQRCGYASEGGAACRDYALTALGLPRVIALVRPENVPSCGVARKIGMKTVDRAVLAGFEHVVYAAGIP